MDKYFAEDLAGSKPADKKTAALLEEAIDATLARIGTAIHEK